MAVKSRSIRSGQIVKPANVDLSFSSQLFVCSLPSVAPSAAELATRTCTCTCTAVGADQSPLTELRLSAAAECLFAPTMFDPSRKSMKTSGQHSPPPTPPLHPHVEKINLQEEKQRNEEGSRSGFLPDCRRTAPTRDWTHWADWARSPQHLQQRQRTPRALNHHLPSLLTACDGAENIFPSS